jgi:acetyltransferase-like isoleucine patch superfamily enzyme
MLRRVIYSFKADRIGPDLPFIHFLIFFKWSRNWICRRKFKYFGNQSEIRPYAYIVGCSNIHIGDRVVIRPNSFIYADTPDDNSGGGIIIEDDVLIGNSCHIYTNNHIFENSNIPISEQGYKIFNDIHISKGAWIGSSSIILPGVQIGINSVVAAGSVVTKNVPAHSLVGGNPARIIRKL